MKIEDIQDNANRVDIVSDVFVMVLRFWNLMGWLTEYDQHGYVKEPTFERSEAERILKIIQTAAADYNSLSDDDKAYLALSWKIHGNVNLTDDDRVYLQKHLDEMTKAWNEYSTK